MICKRKTAATDALLLLFLAITYSITKGTTYVTGVYFIHFQTHLGATATQASLAVGLSTAANFLGGPLYGMIYFALGFRWSCVLSNLLAGFGCMLVSVATSIELVQLFMAIFLGPGAGINQIAIFSVAGKAFTTKRAFTNSIISATATVFAMFLGPLIQDLVETYSWRWSLLILGAIVLNAVPTTLLCDWFSVTGRPIRPEQVRRQTEVRASVTEIATRKEDHKGTDVESFTENMEHKRCDPTKETCCAGRHSWSKYLIDFSLLADPCFVCYLFAMSSSTMAGLAPNFYLVRYAQDTGIDDTQAVWLLSIMNGLYVIGCLLGGLATSYCRGYFDEDVLSLSSDLITNGVDSSRKRFLSSCSKILRTYVLVFLQLFMAATLTIPLFSESYEGFMAYSVLGGFAIGAVGPLPITVLADLFGAEKLPSTMSFRSLSAGVFVLGIPPLIGYLVDVFGDFRPAQYVSCALAMFSAMMTLTTQLLLNRRRES